MKPLSSRLPWILSAVGLALFAVLIAVMVQRWSGPRTPGGTITGGLPGETTGSAGDGTESAPEAAAPPLSGMPSGEELARMAPREAADRLFDRAMAEAEGGDSARAVFFAQMALTAYERVPSGEFDRDAAYHIGALHLVLGMPEAAAGAARILLADDPDHLLGLLLARQAADARGDTAAARDYQRRLEEAAVEEDAWNAPEIQAHRRYIEHETGRESAG